MSILLNWLRYNNKHLTGLLGTLNVRNRRFRFSCPEGYSFWLSYRFKDDAIHYEVIERHKVGRYFLVHFEVHFLS